MPANETSFRPATTSPSADGAANAGVAGAVTVTDLAAVPDAAPPGQRVGPYELCERVGRGGLGDVYRARHATTGQEVALKFLRAGEEATPAEKRSFARELTSARRLSHPN